MKTSETNTSDQDGIQALKEGFFVLKQQLD
jgi:hypothetical protein